MRIGKYIPRPIKNTVLNVVRFPERTKWQIYRAASLGKIPFPDKAFQKWDYHVHSGRKLSFRNPQTFCEKLQWLKYYYRNPEYTRLVDKYAVREYVKEKIGEEYLVPLYGVYEKWEDIDFDQLPDRFVLKCTHDSGSVVICKNKTTFDYEAAKEKIQFCMSRNQFYLSREWPYKNVKPRIICEKFLETDNNVGFTDYKYFCFDGIPKFMWICSDRFSDEGLKENLFDMDGNELPFGEAGVPKNPEIKEPAYAYKKMMELAKVLSSGMPHVRVDFFYINEHILFSELTFYNCGGRHLFEPEEYNKIIGDYLHLPQKIR